MSLSFSRTDYAVRELAFAKRTKGELSVFAKQSDGVRIKGTRLYAALRHTVSSLVINLKLGSIEGLRRKTIVCVSRVSLIRQP